LAKEEPRRRARIEAIPQASKSNPDGSGTGVTPCTSTSKVIVPITSDEPGSEPPRTEKKLGLRTPGAADEPIAITKMSKGLLLAPGFSVSGALSKKSESSSVRELSTNEKLSPFRNSNPSVLFVIVPTTSTELPTVPDTVDNETPTSSA
jgi:hypothetical protein